MVMKKIKSKILLCGLVFFSASCEDFLDISPDSGLKEEEVFSKYENIKSYFNPVYGKIRNAHPFYYNRNNSKWAWETTTEAACQGNNRPSHAIRNGSFGNQNALNIISNSKARPILYESFKAIRICNNVIANAHRVTNAVNPEDVDDLIAQAYFVRGYAYMSMCRLWGGMPYLRQVLTSDDEWDRPRLSAKDTYLEIATDMDSAFVYFEKAGKIRRDPMPGESGHLGSSYQLNLPNGCAALALKSRALLYAASPLSNVNNEDPSLWEKAAEASWQAIKTAEEHGYALLPIDKWLSNTYNAKYTNEQLWADSNGKLAAGAYVTFMTGVMLNNTNFASGICPTQNFVDRYETRPHNGNPGFPMNTEEQRNAAIVAGEFNPQDPYSNLDLRFKYTIFYNEAPLPYKRTRVKETIKNQVNMWYMYKPDGSRIVSDHLISEGYISYCTTGYMQRRLTGDYNWTNTAKKETTDPLFLLSELYLNYAEAANEVGGPDASVGNGPSSLDALMVIRNRAQQSDVRPEFLVNKETFRERIKNERCIELAFLGHYYWDSYRWRDAEKYRTKPLYKIDVEKLPAGYDKSVYPRGYRYTRVEMEESFQTKTWREEMYYLPFTLDMYYQFKNFDTRLNPYW